MPDDRCSYASSEVARIPPIAALTNRRYLLALPVAVVISAVAIGIPTDVFPNPWFTRMTPVRTFDVILWPLTSVAVGALLATVALPRSGAGTHGELSGGAGGGLLSVFAIGCPVCNKLVVLAIGFSGALTYFAPIQPVLGVAALIVTLVVLRRRISAPVEVCPLPDLSAGNTPAKPGDG